MLIIYNRVNRELYQHIFYHIFLAHRIQLKAFKIAYVLLERGQNITKNANGFLAPFVFTLRK